MTDPLRFFDDVVEVGARVSAASRVLLFLSFEGAVAMPAGRGTPFHVPLATRLLLHVLADNPRVSVVMISGQSAADLRGQLGLRSLTYAGSNGLEISGPGLEFLEPAAAQRRYVLENVAREIASQLQHMPGVGVEFHGLAASVDFLQAPAGFGSQVREVVDHALRPVSSLLRLAERNYVCEIRPSVDWHRGAAVAVVREAVGDRQALAFYIGCDGSDEDAFCKLPEGITIRVGHSSGTRARYRVADCAEVRQVLLSTMLRSGCDETPRPPVAGRAGRYQGPKV